jgi:hypothetical protein
MYLKSRLHFPHFKPEILVEMCKMYCFFSFLSSDHPCTIFSVTEQHCAVTYSLLTFILLHFDYFDYVHFCWKVYTVQLSSEDMDIFAACFSKLALNTQHLHYITFSMFQKISICGYCVYCLQLVIFRIRFIDIVKNGNLSY